MGTYLTEKKLGEILKEVKPDLEFIHNRIVPDSGVKYRPDYRCEELKLIIEFDGHGHYTSSKQIQTDLTKDKIYTDMGYKVFRIPYFVQMCDELLYMIFDEDIKYSQFYDHGFIDKKAMLPVDYCELGVDKFLEDLSRFSFCQKDIIKSLKEKSKKKQVVPRRLSYLITNQTYKHYHNGKEYYIIDTVYIQNDKGIWEEGVLYTDKEHKNKFVRTKEEFNKKFKSSVL